MTGPSAAASIRLVVLGDSLTAGYGIAAAEAFPAKLEAALKARGHDISVENAGVSGDTARQGLDRLDWSIGVGADAVIVELGANDALRGIDPEATRASLSEIIMKLKARNVPVLIAGMLAPPNFGAAYKEQFDDIYPSLARQHEVALYPFFLEGVAADPNFNLEDGIHPNAEGVDEITRRIVPAVEKFLAQVKSQPSG